MQSIDIPAELEYTPSTVSRRVHDYRYYIVNRILETLGIKSRSTDSTGAAGKPSSRGTWSKAGIRLGYLITTVGGILGGTYAIDSAYYSLGRVPPTSRLILWCEGGYTTTKVDVLQKAQELELAGCDMKTFCYPGTSKLDESAVWLGSQEIEKARGNRKIVGIDAPRPVGPYVNLKLPAGVSSGDNRLNYTKIAEIENNLNSSSNLEKKEEDLPK